MLIGVGLDIEAFSRFHRILGSRPGLISQIFTARERRLHESAVDPARSYTAGFAIKEAAFKALGSSWTESELFWTDIELLSLSTWGSCEVALSGVALRWQKRRGVEQLLTSLHFTKTHVVAQVWLTSEDAPSSVPDEVQG